MKKSLRITIRFLVALSGIIGAIGAFWSSTTIHRDVNLNEGFLFNSRIKNFSEYEREFKFQVNEKASPLYS